MLWLLRMASAKFRTSVVESANSSSHLLSPVPVPSRQVDRLHPIDELLQPAVPELLQGLTDSDRCSAFGPVISIGLRALDCTPAEAVCPSHRGWSVPVHVQCFLMPWRRPNLASADSL